MGGGHCLFESRYPKQNYMPHILLYHRLTVLVGQSIVITVVTVVYTQQVLVFSYPDTITLMTIVKKN